MAESLKERRNRALAAYDSLTRAAFAFDDLLDKQCDFFGLTTCQYRALEYLLKSGPTAMADLASHILFGDSTVSVVTKNLEKMRLVVRRSDVKGSAQGDRSSDKRGQGYRGEAIAQTRDAGAREDVRARET